MVCHQVRQDLRKPVITLERAFNLNSDNLPCLQGNSILDARAVGGEDLPDAIFFQANDAIGFVRSAGVLFAWRQREFKSALTFPGMFGHAGTPARQQQPHLVDQVVVGLVLAIVAQPRFQFLILVWERDVRPV